LEDQILCSLILNSQWRIKSGESERIESGHSQRIKFHGE
jgi:hypothetical protein